MAQLKLELLKEEAKDLLAGVVQGKTTAGASFCKAIDIEDHR